MFAPKMETSHPSPTPPPCVFLTLILTLPYIILPEMINAIRNIRIVVMTHIVMVFGFFIIWFIDIRPLVWLNVLERVHQACNKGIHMLWVNVVMSCGLETPP